MKIAGKDKLEVKMKLGVLCGILSSNSVRVVKNVRILDEKKTADDTALTLYFCSKEESVNYSLTFSATTTTF